MNKVETEQENSKFSDFFSPSELKELLDKGYIQAPPENNSGEGLSPWDRVTFSAKMSAAVSDKKQREVWSNHFPDSTFEKFLVLRRSDSKLKIYVPENEAEKYLCNGWKTKDDFTVATTSKGIKYALNADGISVHDLNNVAVYLALTAAATGAVIGAATAAPWAISKGLGLARFANGRIKDAKKIVVAGNKFSGIGLSVYQKILIEQRQHKANQGDAESQFLLGEIYAGKESDDTQDFKQAEEWYTRAAEQGHKDAQCMLGEIRIKAKDFKQAEQWYIRAAEQGHVKALSNLGFMYEDGAGVSQDYVLADMWYNIAVNIGAGKDIVKRRDEIESKMSSGDIATAQNKSREYMVKIKNRVLNDEEKRQDKTKSKMSSSDIFSALSLATEAIAKIKKTSKEQ